MGMYTHPPGNQCLEYQEWEIIGKCNIRVATTNVLNADEGSGCSTLKELLIVNVAGTIKPLKAK